MNTVKKIVSCRALKRRIRAAREQGLRVAFTNGCFDLLHMGHVTYLEAAKKTKRILIVGLNSDASVRKIKGPTRPINSQEGRARVLAGLACVDYVTFFDEDTPYQLIAEVQPDILIKGADWKGKDVVGEDIVLARGGKVELIEYLKGQSTTNMIGKIQRKCEKTS